MKNCGCLNVRKHIYTRDGDKYTTLVISLKCVSLEKMKITSSEPKDYMVISRKEFITSLGIKIIGSSTEKSRCAITNVILKYAFKIIKKSERFHYKGYVRKRPTQEPSESYFYLARQLANSMMRADNFNSHVESVRMDMIGMQHINISQVCSLDESKPEGIIAVKNLLQFCSSVESKPETVIVNEISREESG